MYNSNHKFNKFIPFIPGHIVISSIFQRNFLLHTHTHTFNLFLFIYLFNPVVCYWFCLVMKVAVQIEVIFIVPSCISMRHHYLKIWLLHTNKTTTRSCKNHPLFTQYSVQFVYILINFINFKINNYININY
jgi:hypothetical protein